VSSKLLKIIKKTTLHSFIMHAQQSVVKPVKRAFSGLRFNLSTELAYRLI